MRSDKIKGIVAQANIVLESSEDRDIEVINLLDMLVEDGKRSPVFVLAITKHLQASDIDLLEGDSESHRQFQGHFGKALDDLSESDLENIGRITQRLFS